MAITDQAKRIRHALRKAGVRGQLRVRTDVRRYRDRGILVREYGEACSTVFRVGAGHDLAAIAASARGTVYLLRAAGLWFLSSRYAERGAIIEIAEEKS